jgi:predicted hydrocarbon binding protein
MEIEIKTAKTKKKLNLNFLREKGEVRLFGARVALLNPLVACKKMDEIFGTGAEVIVQQAFFTQGYQLFETMLTKSSDKNKEELLKKLTDARSETGWGIVNLKIMNNNPPKIEVTIKNSIVKTLEGSAKHLVSSFWMGVLSKYFNKQLKCERFSYDEKEDKLRCLITA